MKIAIQHLYRPSHEGDGLLYAWFSSMHTRVDILLYSQKPEEELMSVVERIHAALSYLEKIANYYDPASEYKRQNKLFPFLKTFCARFCFINTKQNVHFALSDNMFF